MPGSIVSHWLAGDQFPRTALGWAIDALPTVASASF